MAEDFAKVLAILGKANMKKMEASAIKANYENLSESIKEKISQFKEEIPQKNQKINETQKLIIANNLKIKKIHATQSLDRVEELRAADYLNNRKKEIEALEKECKKKVDDSQSAYLESVKLFEDSLPKYKEVIKTKDDIKELTFELNIVEAKIKYKEAQYKQIKEIQKKKLNSSIISLATAIREREEHARVMNEIKIFQTKIQEKQNRSDVQIGIKEIANEKVKDPMAKDRNIYDFDNFEFQDINFSFEENLSSKIKTPSESIDSIMQNVLKLELHTTDKKQYSNSNKELPISIVNKKGKTSNNLQKSVRFSKEKAPQSTLKKLEIPRKHSELMRQNSKIEILKNAKLALSGRSITKLDSKVETGNQSKEPENSATKSDTLQIIKPGLQPRPGFKTPDLLAKQSVMKQKLRFEDTENVKITLSNRSPKKLGSKIKSVKSTRFGVLSEKNYDSNSNNINNTPNEFQPSPKKQKIDLEFKTPQASSKNMFEVNNEYKSPSFEMNLNANGSPTFNFDLQTSPFQSENMEESINDPGNFNANEFDENNMFY